jgi:parallel beta-helix repeat protein
VFPFFVFAYDDKTTHPALTQETVSFFNLSYPSSIISEGGKELIIQGSIDEDSGTRWMHHFYDPVHQRGLVFEDSKLQKYPELAAIAAGVKSEWESSKEWAENTSLQRGRIAGIAGGIFTDYFSGSNDYSWDRAIYDYAWGDRNRGLKALGHILHLLQDAAVPDHTRNDPHPPILEAGSPYEHWAKRFDRSTIRIDVQNSKPIILTSLTDYFDTLALYSNKNFFSEDTIYKENYTRPIEEYTKIEEDEPGLFKKYGYSRIDGKDGPLLLYTKFSWKTFGKKYTLEDDKVLYNYWSLLSKQAVLHGAGVIKLFFDEVEKEKKTKILYEKNRPWIGKKFDAVNEKVKEAAFKTADIFYGITVSQTPLEENPTPAASKEEPPKNEPALPQFTSQETPPAEPQGSDEENLLPAQSADTEIAENPPQPPEPIPAKNPPPDTPPPPPAPARKNAPQNPVAPPIPKPLAALIPPPPKNSPPPPPPLLNLLNLPSLTAAIEAAITPGSADSSPTDSAETPPPPPFFSTRDKTPPAPVLVLGPAPDNALSTSTAVTFLGSAEKGAEISTSFSKKTAIADDLGQWSLALASLPEGTTTVTFFAKDRAGNISEGSRRSVFIDSIAPEISFSIAECAQSLSPSGCAVAASKISLLWSSSSPDRDVFLIECETNGSPCPNFPPLRTASTSAAYILPADNTAYLFKARAIDRAGLPSNTASISISLFIRPVVINEIGWAGTSATRSHDEWIELYNPTPIAIDLSSFKLKSKTDAKPNIQLQGVLAPGDYYLIERGDDATISNIPANLTESFGSGNGAGLSNSGETLVLEYRGLTIDKTPEVSACSGWCGGSTSNAFYTSMERYDPFERGEDSLNWGTWGGITKNGLSADSPPQAINGTPGKRNALNHFINRNVGSITENKILTKTGSPYVIGNDFKILPGATLTIKEGVVVKFTSHASLIVQGSLKVEGTAAEPVVFTSLKDDAQGGDTNGDSSATSPSPGDWGSVRILANGSSIESAVFRFGGWRDISGVFWTNLRAENAEVAIRNSTFERSNAFGLSLKNVSGIFEGNTVRDNNVDHSTDSTGLFMQDGSITVRNNLFERNTVGIQILGGNASEVSGNTFTKNTYSPVTLSGDSVPTFSNNTASSNRENGIALTGGFSKNYALSGNLPYIIGSGFTVFPGVTLTIPPGAVIKLTASGSLIVQGILKAEGTPANKIIFTSLKDDGYGGDADSNGALGVPRAGDWRFLSFNNPLSTSTLAHVLIRYGGDSSHNQTSYGAIHVDGGALEISNAVIEENNFIGVRMENAAAVAIRDSLIRNHVYPPHPEPAYGMALFSSSTPALINTTFRNNRTSHILRDGTSHEIDGGGNIFE